LPKRCRSMPTAAKHDFTDEGGTMSTVGPSQIIQQLSAF
jgi:hypothetical protein